MPLVKTASDALEDYILNGRPDSEYTEIFLGISLPYYAIQRDIKFPESEYLFPARDGGAYSATRIQNRFRKFYELFCPDVPKELLPAVRVYDLRYPNLNRIQTFCR